MGAASGPEMQCTLVCPIRKFCFSYDMGCLGTRDYSVRLAFSWILGISLLKSAVVVVVVASFQKPTLSKIQSSFVPNVWPKVRFRSGGDRLKHSLSRGGGCVPSTRESVGRLNTKTLKHAILFPLSTTWSQFVCSANQHPNTIKK